MSGPAVAKARLASALMLPCSFPAVSPWLLLGLSLPDMPRAPPGWLAAGSGLASGTGASVPGLFGPGRFTRSLPFPPFPPFLPAPALPVLLRGGAGRRRLHADFLHEGYQPAEVPHRQVLLSPGFLQQAVEFLRVVAPALVGPEPLAAPEALPSPPHSWQVITLFPPWLTCSCLKAP